MGYFILLLTIIIYLLRPAEWIPALYFNWNMLLNGLSLIFLLGIALSKRNKFNYDRLTMFLLWFVVAMMLSNIFNGQLSTISAYFSQMLSTVIIFVLVQSAIQTKNQISYFILTIILMILFICYQCYLQATIGYAWGGLEPFSRGLISSIDADTGVSTVREIQVIWYGILGDPNDLGMLLIAFVPYIFSKIFYQPSSILKKTLWLISIFIIGYTVMLTNSRGSMLSLIGGMACFYIIKKRSMSGFIVAAILGIALLALAPSRMGELTSGDHSAMGRVYAWILALELFAMKPIFGIGAQHFLDYHSLTTHNSYVLAFVENGFLGFVGYISLFILAVYTGVQVALKEQNKALSIEIISLVSGLLGILISIFFISRTYVLLPFLFIAIITTYMRIHCYEAYQESIKALSLIKLVAYAFGFIVFIYIFNRLTTSILI